MIINKSKIYKYPLMKKYSYKTMSHAMRASYTPFHRQNYRSGRDAEKRLGTNITGKNLLPPSVVCFFFGNKDSCH